MPVSAANRIDTDLNDARLMRFAMFTGILPGQFIKVFAVIGKIARARLDT